MAWAMAACAAEAGEVTGGVASEPSLQEVENVARRIGPLVSTTEICFTVHVPGDPTDYTVKGTLFDRFKFLPGRTTLLLQHGGFAERSSWDGGRPTVTEAVRMAPMLTAINHNVVTVDRLGFGESPYPGSGYDLGKDAYSAMTGEMVQQLKDGTFRKAKNGSCANSKPQSYAAENVVLVGYSVGSGYSEHYALHGGAANVEGVVSLAWANHGASAAFGGLVDALLVPQLLEGKDYVSVALPEEDGFSEATAGGLFWAPGIQPEALQQLCGPEYYLDPTKNVSPAAEVIDVLALMADNAAAVNNIGDLPILKIYSDHDVIFPNPDFLGYDGTEADLTTPDIEAYEAAASDFEYDYAYEAGHNSWWIDSTPLTSLRILFWLYDHGL